MIDCVPQNRLSSLRGPDSVAAGSVSPSTSLGTQGTLAAYVALTKPRIIELLLIATVPTMFAAAHGVPPVGLIIATIVGGALSAGSAGAFNSYFDRDIDRLMSRTKRRPLVTGAVSPRGALVFAVILGALSIAVLAVFVNVLSAALSVVGLLLYVVLYTLVLKRRTSQNIIWGGAAGCVPALIGWSSVRDEISAVSIVLFAIVFLWTPAHYWPLSVKYEADYRSANVPMLSVTLSTRSVMRRVRGYAIATVALTLVLIPLAAAGPVYTLTSVLAGAWFLRRAVLGVRESARPMEMFHASITYLAVIFIAVGVDPFVPW